MKHIRITASLSFFFALATPCIPTSTYDWFNILPAENSQNIQATTYDKQVF